MVEGVGEATPGNMDTPSSATHVDATPSGLRQRQLSSAQKARKRLDLQVKAAAEGQEPPLTELFRQAEPALKIATQAVQKIVPFYIWGGKLVVEVYNTLPIDILHALTGLALCFFGGAYCASIAAVEAFVLMGWTTTHAALEEVYADVKLIWAAHEDDEKKSGDAEVKGNLLSCVESLPMRKLRVAADAVRDPEKLTMALGGLYAGWIAVQGTLRLQFARTITLGLSIAEMLDAPALRCGLPVLAHIVPPSFHRWLPTLIRTAAKGVAVFIAWYLHVAIAAFQSALRGGLMCSRALLKWANKRGLIEVNEEDTNMDEVIGYGLCLLGFYTQICWGFALPFPFNIVLLPFTTVEWYIRWSVTS